MILKWQKSSFAAGLAGQHAAGKSAGEATDTAA
jgi:hypothetical protein